MLRVYTRQRIFQTIIFACWRSVKCNKINLGEKIMHTPLCSVRIIIGIFQPQIGRKIRKYSSLGLKKNKKKLIYLSYTIKKWEVNILMSQHLRIISSFSQGQSIKLQIDIAAAYKHMFSRIEIGSVCFVHNSQVIPSSRNHWHYFFKSGINYWNNQLHFVLAMDRFHKQWRPCTNQRK